MSNLQKWQFCWVRHWQIPWIQSREKRNILVPCFWRWDFPWFSQTFNTPIFLWKLGNVRPLHIFFLNASISWNEVGLLFGLIFEPLWSVCWFIFKDCSRTIIFNNIFTTSHQVFMDLLIEISRFFRLFFVKDLTKK